MGCSGSKAENLPLVVRCRERRELIRAAANHRFALAAAHVSYFSSLKDVGDALRKFVDEELINTSPSSSSSPVSSPSLISPPASKVKRNHDESLHLHEDEDEEEEEEESHLHLSDSSSDNDGDSKGNYKHLRHERHSHDSDNGRHHHHIHGSHKGKGFNGGEKSFHNYPGGGFYGHGHGLMGNRSKYRSSLPPRRSYVELYMDQPWFNYSNNSNVHYMKKSAPAMKTVVHEPPAQPGHGYSGSYWNSPAGHGDDHGSFPMGPALKMGNNEGVLSHKKEAPPPPSPKVSMWDAFNPFDVFDGAYTGYNSAGRYGYGSTFSSPHSSEVREMEGIPDLEEETENEGYKDAPKVKKMNIEAKESSKESTSSYKSVPLQISTESSSRSVPLSCSDGSKKPLSPLQYSGENAKRSMPTECSEEKLSRNQYLNGDIEGLISLTDEKSSPETLVSKNVDECSVKKQGEAFEVEWESKADVDLSRLSSVTISSPHGTRDLREVVAELRDDFEIASSYGKEVAIMLEVGKLPYQPGFLKVLASSDSSSKQSVKLASRSMKTAKSYFDDVGKDMNANVCSLLSTLDKLYAWEKKLYKEVKASSYSLRLFNEKSYSIICLILHRVRSQFHKMDEERLRLKYEKRCKKLKILDKEGVDSGKIYATQASIRRLVTKLDVSIKAIDVISSRIDKLRDEELQPKIAALIQGLIRMWKAMLKCHQKQFQAIMESKRCEFKVNTALQRDSNSSAITELGKVLHSWCHHFNDWVNFQKSYVKSLNGWLLKCLQYEPEETPDGPVPYSPGQLGAPPIFIICNDWHQAMEAVSEGRVARAMNAFVTSLQQLGEKQDEEERRRLKAECLSKEYEKLLRAWKRERGQGTMSEKNGLSLVQSEAEVSTLDDLKLDLDSLRQRLSEERIKNKDAMKLVQNAASSSLKGGLVLIFRALENFTSEALKAHEYIRVQHPHQSL
ncbi:hypothetical protein CDL12_27198 [Handroanthus impetiginosus]|uniref:DUF632 domain-containing protein n=1 Tax=Handroanthus impetiginosus TaxID=429701 RepID=A0A2G9G533_9LAMI|nr:hypothetical protein CDL12_27198 [Handroanthus impetiginosus]